MSAFFVLWRGPTGRTSWDGPFASRETAAAKAEVRERVTPVIAHGSDPELCESGALRLLEEALHLRMNGERAPGGNETWRDWERRVEMYLRSLVTKTDSAEMEG